MKPGWSRWRAADFIEFNPRPAIRRDAPAAKISMDKLLPFTKSVLEAERAFFSGGSRFCNGDTLMARITPCLENGKTAFVDFLRDGEVGFGSTEFIVMRARPGISDPQFVYYLATSPAFRSVAVKSMVGSSGRQRVQQGVLDELELAVPPLEEQRRIGSVLSALDAKITLNRRMNRNLRRQMRALYHSWFVEPVPFGGRPPEGWERSGIYALADIIYGAPFSSKLFNSEGRGRPVVRIRDLKEQRFHTFTTEMHPRGYLIQAGDIVVGMDGEFRPYIWGNEEAWLNQRVCVLKNRRPKGKAFLLCAAEPLLRGVEQTQVGTTVIHIGKKDFDNFELLLPPEEVLDAFDALTHPMVERIVTNSLESKRLAALRDALLPRLMSGETGVPGVRL